MMKCLIIYPESGHTAYRIAADTFASLAVTVSKADITQISDLAFRNLSEEEKAVYDLRIIIGSDSVNDYAAGLLLSKTLDFPCISYGTDAYTVKTFTDNGVKCLLFFSGRPRAAIYAVYRYFEKYCGCRYFWDGDRLTETELPTENIDLTESPRFEYRGLRYFAHRSLHRFQAEQWSLDDWQNEIDWMLKKRLNLFMLRIGMDDMFQKAFPDIVPYPDYTKALPEAESGYDDRSLFWSLEYRGELRGKLLAYAFARDIMHPEDCGTMTHWYSRTPQAYLDKVQPTTLVQNSSNYYGRKTGHVWDIRDQKNLNNYFKLTEAHINAYGTPNLFHTIGLAERSFYPDREQNLRLKLYVYRRIAEYLRTHYPNAPLLIASWDLWMFYSPEEVQRLIAELDPNQSILLDYTSDTIRESNFTKWGVVGKFPWIFGIFSGYESQNDIRGLYHLTNERIEIAKNDSFCKGVILWPELSHGDTLIGEYLALNAWEADTMPIDELLQKFTSDRYPSEKADVMLSVWREFMPLVELYAWSGKYSYFTFPCLPYRNVFASTWSGHYDTLITELQANQTKAVDTLVKLAGICDTDDGMLCRDIYDIARSLIDRYIDGSMMYAAKLYATTGDTVRMADSMEMTVRLNSLLADLLSLHTDYSLLDSLEKLRTVTDTNPNFELTLKHNADNSYCRSDIYENVRYLYVPEMKALFEAVLTAKKCGKPIDNAALRQRYADILRYYEDTPLSVLNRGEKPVLKDVLLTAAGLIADIKF